MIRKVRKEDATTITAIYNEYVLNTAITFETEAVSEKEMEHRIAEISNQYPYLVYEDDHHVVLGYCYAHQWKTRAAYRLTLETTIYVASQRKGEGIGTLLMNRLVAECRRGKFHALVACVTSENPKSATFHQHMGFSKVTCFKEVGMKFGRRVDVSDFELILE
ncbi:MAG: N-acetyltransferase family protein [Paludibacteraceae bacterium]